MIKKKLFSIIGNPISHSLSPLLHNYWFKKYKIVANYNLLQIDESDIEKTLDKVRKSEISGINVTLPYKQKVLPYLDKVVNDAKSCNSVNTIYLDQNKKLVGDNTDVYGFQAGYLKEVVDKSQTNQNALVLGAGGVSPSIIYSLKKSNINNITVTNRTYEKGIFLKKIFPFIQILKWEEYEAELKNFDIIINATSLGLKGNENFQSLFKDFKSSLIYIDTIYNPIQTKMIKHLKSNNIKTFNGLEMFMYQGQKSFYLWNKVNPEINDEIIDLLMSKIND